MSSQRTPAQTAGLFFGFALPWPDGAWAVAPGTPGAIRIQGQVVDGHGEPVPDVLVETWQVGPAEARGFGRCPTDEEGRYAIVTLKPKRLDGGDGTTHAPHLALSLFGRGLSRRLVTRIYFADEEEANAGDPLLAAIGDRATRATLLATRTEGGYRFDIRLQGGRETVFFEV
jgi:protocatechuate 3,4-dioxygenase, alpha subunit